MKNYRRSLVYILFSVMLIVLSFGSCKKDPSPEADKAYQPNLQRLRRHFNEIPRRAGTATVDSAVLIDGNDNKLFLVSDSNGELTIIAAYDISPSKYGYGSARGSNQTPRGVHEIAGKYGAGQPSGMCFYDRKPTGEIATIYTDTTDVEDDPVTSRILWLKGLEDINRTSYWRFIYIHGTNEEGLIGTPQSKGCIRMRNSDIIEFFDTIDTGMYVNIIRPENDTDSEEE
ncbi:MAG: L,D-transpeptidase [Candidatus Marinimicrobia bacterium]|nr:L,D-transpeptidase [Candidatus Neomarinimicrobiota bacterium]